MSITVRVWQRQAADLGLDARALVSRAVEISAAPERGMAAEEPAGSGRDAPSATTVLQKIDGAPPHSGGRDRAADASPQAELPFDAPAHTPARNSEREASAPSRAAEAVAWAMAHLSEREAVFARTDLLAAALAHGPGAVAIGEVEREVAALEKAGTLHAVDLPDAEDSFATDRTVGEEREAVALMRSGEGRGRAPMRGWQVQAHLNKGPLTAGQKAAVKLILSAKDRKAEAGYDLVPEVVILVARLGGADALAKGGTGGHRAAPWSSRAAVGHNRKRPRRRLHKEAPPPGPHG